jgi:hypothetical protein
MIDVLLLQQQYKHAKGDGCHDTHRYGALPRPATNTHLIIGRGDC